MPNWCMNELTVSGEADEVKRFVDSSMGLPAQYSLTAWEKEWGFKKKKAKTPYFSFNALVPTPQEVLDTGYDARDRIPELTRRYAVLGQEIGLLDGFHWNIVHWGTKWDVYEEHLGAEEMGWQEGCRQISFEFDTAWSPPLAWMKQAVARFPSLSFLLRYAEPGCYFAGNAFGENGYLWTHDYEGKALDDVFRRLYGKDFLQDDPEDVPENAVI